MPRPRTTPLDRLRLDPFASVLDFARRRVLSQERSPSGKVGAFHTQEAADDLHALGISRNPASLHANLKQLVADGFLVKVHRAEWRLAAKALDLIAWERMRASLEEMAEPPVTQRLRAEDYRYVFAHAVLGRAFREEDRERLRSSRALRDTIRSSAGSIYATLRRIRQDRETVPPFTLILAFGEDAATAAEERQMAHAWLRREVKRQTGYDGPLALD